MPAPAPGLAAWATALGVLIAPVLALADIPIGSFEFELGGVNSLWMGGGEDTHEDADGFCASFGQNFDVVEACSFRLTVDGRGSSAATSPSPACSPATASPSRGRSRSAARRQPQRHHARLLPGAPRAARRVEAALCWRRTWI